MPKPVANTANIIKFPGLAAAAPVTPAFAHPGGKRRLLKHILPHLPTHRVYVEPFAGAAAVLLAKERAGLEVLNDIAGDMITFYNYSVHHREALLAELGKHAPQSRRNFDTLLRNPGITELQRAARWFILKTCSFGSQGEAWGRDRRNYHGYDPVRHNALIDRLGDRLQRVVIESRDWTEVVNFYDSPETFFFFDPPYVNCCDTAYAAFTPAQMSELRERLDTMSGTWLLTCDDSEACRAIFAGLPAQSLAIKYSLGNKAASKHDRARGKAADADSATGHTGVKTSGELLIFSSDIAPPGIEKLPARAATPRVAPVKFTADATVKKRRCKNAA